MSKLVETINCILINIEELNLRDYCYESDKGYRLFTFYDVDKKELFYRMNKSKDWYRETALKAFQYDEKKKDGIFINCHTEGSKRVISKGFDCDDDATIRQFIITKYEHKMGPEGKIIYEYRIKTSKPKAFIIDDHKDKIIEQIESFIMEIKLRY